MKKQIIHTKYELILYYSQLALSL